MSFDKKYNTGLGEPLDDAIARFDEFLSDGATEFIAGLWDSQAGGFYYSNSAKEYKGFTPDAESTLQVLNLLSSGAIQGVKGHLPEKLPCDIKDKLLSFSDTSESRGKAIKEKLGALPESTDGAKPAAKSAPPKKYETKEQLIAFLDETFASSDASVKLKAEIANIKSSSMLDTMFDYLDGAAFSKLEGYASAAEVYKIGSIYNDEKRKIARASEILEYVLVLIASDDAPDSVTDIYNAWAALRILLQNAENYGESDKALAYSCVRSVADIIVNKTLEKLLAFKKSDGGYSYYQAATPGVVSGKRVSLGIAEGDINSTVTVLHGVRGNVFSCLGLTTPPLFPAITFTALVDMMYSAKPIKKRRIPLKYLKMQKRRPV